MYILPANAFDYILHLDLLSLTQPNHPHDFTSATFTFGAVS